MASNSLAVKLLGAFGILGSAASMSSLVPRSDTPAGRQQALSDFGADGVVSDADIWSRYTGQMSRPVSFEATLQLWNEMAGWDLIAAALSEIVHEATQTDEYSPSVLWYECNDKDVQDDLNEMLERINHEDILPSQVWHTAGLGNNFEKIDYEPDAGVRGVSFVHPMDVRRYWLERNRKCIGFRWNSHKPDKTPAYTLPDGTEIQPVAINHGGESIENLYYPWDFMHIRRMFRMRSSEHGEPIFEEAQGIYKKLRMAIDQMVVHRAQVQPDRYVVNIDVKEQPPSEQMRTVQRWKQSLRSKLAFGAGGDGTALGDPTKFESFHNPLAIDTVLWVARPTGFTHTIDKLAGTTNVPDVYDIELLTDLFFSIIGMPKAWFGATKGGENPPSGKALLAQDIRFLRKIKSIRRPILNAYRWLGYFHVALQGKHNDKLDSLEIQAKMSPIGSLEEQLKLEMLQMQSDVLTSLGDVMDKYALPKQAWIELVFKRYMHLPDDVVNTMMTALPAEATPDVPESRQHPHQPAPRSYRLLREIEELVAGNPATASKVAELRTLQRTQSVKAEKLRRVKSLRDVFEFPTMKESELVVSSFGKDPLSATGVDNRPLPGKKAVYLMDSATLSIVQKRGNGAAVLEESAAPRTASYLKKFRPC